LAHPIPMKEIALQAGVGLATVDRVLNARPGVGARTEQRVRQAIAELARQTQQPMRGRRRLLIDLVMDAPGRFALAVRQAIETLLPDLPQAAFRVRFHLTELATPAEIAAVLGRIARRGSHGVILKAPDLPGIADAVGTLAAAGIPTVTLVTDLPSSRRIATVGLDNHAAGAVAAYLIAAWMGDRPAKVLVTLSSHRFLGEEQRELGFIETLRHRAPGLCAVRLDEGRGLDRATFALASAALEAEPAIAAVYSIGGGNQAILNAFRAANCACRVLVGHDLDSDNRSLLRDGAIQAVLHHDLATDLRLACRAILEAHRILPRGSVPPLSTPSIVTPFNLP
jgi:LacI family transcriptional regulator